MVLTYDQRLELLKKAREAKKNKKLAKESLSPSHDPQEQNEEPETPKKSRSKSVKPPKGRTLELPPEPSQLPDFIDSEPEVEEQIIYKPKSKKKKIIRRVIMEASSDEEEVEVIEERVKAPKHEKQVKHEITPKAEPNNPFFNF